MSTVLKNCKREKEEDIATDKERKSTAFKRCKIEREDNITDKKGMSTTFKTCKSEKGSLLPNNDCILFLQDIDSPSNIFFLQNYDTDHISCHKLTLPASIPRTEYGLFVTAEFVGSCNGLLCLKYVCLDFGQSIFYVCNPILGDFTALPASSPACYEPSAFGFCPKTKQYKVIGFRHTCNYFEILTLGTEIWRRVDAPCPSAQLSDSSFQGNLHWTVEISPGALKMCAFNLETEQYSYLSAPPRDFHGRMTNFYVGTLDGLFCISYVLDEVHFEAWVMKDYGVKESWTKKISVKANFSLKGARKFLNNGILVLNPFGNSAICYNTLTGTTAEIPGGLYTAISLVPSHVSLKDIVRPENVEEGDKLLLAS